jgi:hypothetical protein
METWKAALARPVVAHNSAADAPAVRATGDRETAMAAAGRKEAAAGPAAAAVAAIAMRLRQPAHRRASTRQLTADQPFMRPMVEPVQPPNAPPMRVRRRRHRPMQVPMQARSLHLPVFPAIALRNRIATQRPSAARPRLPSRNCKRDEPPIARMIRIITKKGNHEIHEKRERDCGAGVLACFLHFVASQPSLSS